jgi:hypothetical protein
MATSKARGATGDDPPNRSKTRIKKRVPSDVNARVSSRIHRKRRPRHRLPKLLNGHHEELKRIVLSALRAAVTALAAEAVKAWIKTPISKYPAAWWVKIYDGWRMHTNSARVSGAYTG